MPARRSMPRKLKPRHKKFLIERAVSAEFAEARGYFSLEDESEFRELGWETRGRNAPGNWVRPPGLGIPIYSVLDLSLGEEEPSYGQYRPDRPTTDKEGKVRKYLNPTGTQAVIDINPLGFTSEEWMARDEPLFIVEGVPKGDACWTAGIPAVSIQGVWNFTTENEDSYRELLADLRYLPVAGREVVIAFDADAWTNPDVRAAARELGRILSRGKNGAAKVSALRLPDPKKKTGIDDFLARGHKDPKEAVYNLIVDLSELAEERGARLRPLSEVEAKPPECLWEPYFMRDTLVFFDGAPGVGKTMIALDVCAKITKGGSLPMGWRDQSELTKTELSKGNVVYLTSENDPERSLRPRFDRLGGDPKRFFIDDSTIENEEQYFTLHDLGPLRRMIEEVNPVLVVLDPVMNFIGEKTDAHRDNEVRPMLGRLMRLANESGTTIMGIRHLRKAATGSAVYAAGGSVAFSGAARSVVIASKFFDDTLGAERTVMAHAKTSDTPLGATLEYKIENAGKDKDGFYLTTFEWVGRADIRADDLVGENAGKSRETKADQVKDLIGGLLDENPDGVHAAIALQAAKAMGIGEKTVRKAAEEMGVEKVRVGGSGKEGKWVWQWGKHKAKPVRRKPAQTSKF